MTKTKRNAKLQTVIDILKDEFGECDEYVFGCTDCQVKRIIEDLEDIKNLYYQS